MWQHWTGVETQSEYETMTVKFRATAHNTIIECLTYTGIILLFNCHRNLTMRLQTQTQSTYSIRHAQLTPAQCGPPFIRVRPSAHRVCVQALSCIGKFPSRCTRTHVPNARTATTWCTRSAVMPIRSSNEIWISLVWNTVRQLHRTCDQVSVYLCL